MAIPAPGAVLMSLDTDGRSAAPVTGGVRWRAWATGRPPVRRLAAGHRLRLLIGGDALFAEMVQAMNAARTSIHLETYIFDFRRGPVSVAEALEQAALRGVTVRLLVDGVGTAIMPVEWQQRLSTAGVQWRVFAPLGRFGLFFPSRWRRLHRKLCVVDGVLGFCGGINLLDDLIDNKVKNLPRPRLDFAVRCTGPLVDDMGDTMLQTWWRLLAVSKARQHQFGAAWQALKTGSSVGDFSSVLPLGLTGSESAPALPPVVDNAQAMLVLRDNIWHRTDIERAYLKAIGEARQDVLLANAYFVPGRRMRRALKLAARRGVRVRVLMQGQYESFMQYHAARPVYKQLIDAGVDVREYTPSAMHAKVAVIDGRWATVGSSNLDPLSLLLAREANVVTTDEVFARDLRQRLLDAMDQGGRALDHEALTQRPWPQRLLDWVAFVLMRVLLYLSGHRY